MKRILFIIAILSFSAICSGQQPLDKKPSRHFAADIRKVDSILSVALDFNRQRALLMPLHHLKCPKDFIQFELYKETSSARRLLQ